MRQFKTTIFNSNFYCSTSSTLVRPERNHQLKNDLSPLIARGFGSCPSDASLNSRENILLMERLNRFIAFDEETGILRAEAGVSLGNILSYFVPRGWFLPVTPSTKRSTLGGCVATNTFGKNHSSMGSFGKHIQSLQIVLADGTINSCDSSNNPDLFWASIGGMGLTGIIAEVTIKLQPIESAYVCVQQNPTKNLEETLVRMAHVSPNFPYVSAWVDTNASGNAWGRSVLYQANHSSLQQIPQKIKNPLEGKALKQHAISYPIPLPLIRTSLIRMWNQLYYSSQTKKKKSYVCHYEDFFYFKDQFVNWHHIFGKKGYIFYQFAVPQETALRCFENVLHRFSQNSIPILHAELIRFGKENGNFLAFPKEGFCLSLAIPIKDKSLFIFLDQIDEVIMKFGGRVSFATDFRMNSVTFRAMYSKMGQWQRIKSLLDPEQRFNSDLSRRLKMSEVL